MKKITFWKSFFLLFALIVGYSNAWATEGDELAKCQGTGQGYAYGRTLTDSHSVGWFLSICQTGYFGANSADNHGKSKPSADDLPIVKAVKSDATTSTTGYYFYYTTTPVSNVGSLEFSYNSNSGNQTATAYVVVGDAKPASGGDAFEIIELANSSTTAQGASLGTSGTFTYKFKEKQTSARYYGFVIVTSSYKRMGDATIKLLEGATITSPTIDAGNINIYDDVTNGSIAYTINNAVDGGVLSAARTVDADTWLTVGEVTSTTVPFTTSVNTGEERSTTVRLTYTYDTDKTVTKDVTVTQSAPITRYTVTITQQTGGTLVVKQGETTVNTGDRIPEGTVLNITATADERYKYRNWQYKREGGSWVTNTTATTYTMTAANVEFRANFDAREYHNANFSINGTVTAVEYENGETINFPANPEDINGTKFVGWSVTTIEGTTNTKPAFVKSAKMGDADVTFYAVFAAAEGDGVETITYEKLTSNSFDADATYVIGAMNGNNLALFYSYDNTVDSEASWGKMSTDYTKTPPLTFTLSGTASALYVKDNNGNYLQGKVNNFRMVSEENKSSITLASNGSLHDVQSANNTERWLRYNTGAGYGLRWYATSTSTGNLAYFYKKIVDPGYTYSSYCTTVPTTGTITLNAACHDGNGTIYGTFYTNRAYVMPENVEGQVVSVDDEGKLEVYDAYDPGDVVPAFTALLLYTIDEFTGTKDYTINYTTGGTDLSDYNMLKGTLTADEDTEGDNCLFYRLTMHKGTTIGFYWGAENGGAFKPGANKAYLAVPNSGGNAKAGFAFEENIVNGIDNVTVEPFNDNTPMYNLAGQRVTKSYKGVVIQNGKKVLKK